MLNINKSININATSVINGEIVVYMNATLSTTGNGSESITKNINNQDLYNSNKAAVRKDMREFEDLIYLEQDKIDSTPNNKKGEN